MARPVKPEHAIRPFDGRRGYQLLALRQSIMPGCAGNCALHNVPYGCLDRRRSPAMPTNQVFHTAAQYRLVVRQMFGQCSGERWSGRVLPMAPKRSIGCR